MLTLLFDLDDTLLDSNMETFIPAYFQALSRYLAPTVPPDAMLPALVAGTRQMMANEDPSRTLREVFDAEFFPKMGVDRPTLQNAIEEFYDNVFPRLAGVTRPRPEAVQLIEWAFAQGHRVAIATDPLFPLKATLHRLRFAGLPPEKYPFALVSSYETFHFTKSYVAYYAEFLGRLGWPDGPLLMVGNDAERDLAPARALGLPTFWINGDQPKASDPEANGRGTLSDLRGWLESTDLKSLEAQLKSRESILALMTATPAVISSLIDELPASSWTARPASEEWALTEVLCHLRDTEREVNQARLQRLTTENEPFIPSRDTDGWAEERQYIKQDGRAGFNDFLTSRLETLKTLKELSDSDWARKARHSIFGPTTLQEMVGFMTSHDRMHIQQIWKLVHPS
ncbi:MAG TPA: DinB family protein [Anaerolineales bacterium]|nr:DinB family protein [Anaerolineales bacterium]